MTEKNLRPAPPLLLERSSPTGSSRKDLTPAACTPALWVTNHMGLFIGLRSEALGPRESFKLLLPPADALRALEELKKWESKIREAVENGGTPQ